MKTQIGLSDRTIRLLVGLILLGLGTALETP